MLFAQLQQRIQGAAAHQPEIASIGRQLHLAADPLHQPIKRVSGCLFQPGFAGAGIALRIGNIKALAPGGDQIRDHLGRVLQIGVNHDHCLCPAGVIQAGRERNLLAEIAAEIEYGHTVILRLKAEHDGQRAILRPIIHIDHFPRRPDASQRCRQPRMELGQYLLLVISRDDNGKCGRVLGQKRGLNGFLKGVITTEMGRKHGPARPSSGVWPWFCIPHWNPGCLSLNERSLPACRPRAI